MRADRPPQPYCRHYCFARLSENDTGTPFTPDEVAEFPPDLAVLPSHARKPVGLVFRRRQTSPAVASTGPQSWELA